MGGGKAATVAALLALVLLALLPATSALDPPSLATEDGLSHAYLQFGQEIERRPAPMTVDRACEEPPASGDGIPINALTPELPRQGEPARVQASRSADVAACSTNFRFNATAPFIFHPGSAVTFWAICGELPVVATQVGDNAGVRVIVLRNDEVLADEDRPLPNTAGLAICPQEDPARFDVTIDGGPVSFSVGDTLEIQIYFFVADPTAQTTFLVGSLSTPSSLHGPGLPGLLRPTVTSPLAADVGNRTQATAPGNVTTHGLVLRNLGPAPREVTLSAEGPEGWIAQPSPGTATLAPESELVVNVTVGAPFQALPGDEATHRVTIRSGQETLVFETTTRVEQGAGSFAPGLAEQLGVQAEEADGGVFDLLSEVGVELTATVIVAATASVVGLLRTRG